MRLDLSTQDGVKSMRIGFTDQRLTAHGGLAVWTRYVTERGLREQLRAVLPHAPTSPNAYDPTDTALGFIGGILCGADKLARVAHLAHDPAVAEVLGIEAIPSQSTLSRFFARCGRSAGEGRGLCARPGFLLPDPRGRSSGGRAGGLHPQGPQALPPPDRGGDCRDSAGRALLAAAG